MSSGSGSTGAAGFYYYFTIHMGLGRGPVDEVVSAKVGDKLAWQGHATLADPASLVQAINVPELFGGPTKEGGIQGSFQVMMGQDGQETPDALYSIISPAPRTGFRRMLTIFFNGMIGALNPYPKPWSWRVRRATQGWDGDPFRPDLAIIDMLGEEVAGAASTARQQASASENQRVVPVRHGVVLHYPGGGDAWRVSDVTAAQAEIVTGTGDNIQYRTEDTGWGVVYRDDGGADVMVNARYAGMNVTVYVTITHADASTNPSAATLNSTEIPFSVMIDYTIPNGGTMSALTALFYNNTGGTDTLPTGDVPHTVVTNIPGLVTIAVSPLYWNKTLGFSCFYNDGTGAHVYTNEVTKVLHMDDAPMVELHPPVGNVASVQEVWTSNALAPGSNPSNPKDSTIVSYPVMFEYNPDDGNFVKVRSPANEGDYCYFNYNFFTDYDGGNLIPDRTIKAMNPAHIIYEALTNREWGRGLDRSLIDAASFEVAAQTLVNEQFGGCGRWNRRDSIDSFIQGILDFCGATLYSSKTTALLTLFLIRGDYDRDSLKLWDTSNGLLEITDSTVNTSSVIINEIIVKYRDPVFNADRTINLQNLASLQSSGGAFNTRSTSYPFCPTSGLALRLAQRDLRGYAEGLRRFKITVDRRGRDLFPGQVMRIRDAARNIPDTVVRIATSKEGVLTDGRITMDVVQDVFSFPATSYVQQQPNTWAPPNYTPCSPEQQAFEIPYFLLSRTMRPADFAYVTNGSAFVGVLAAQGQRINTGYQIAVRDHAPTSDDQPTLEDQRFCGYEP